MTKTLWIKRMLLQIAAVVVFSNSNKDCSDNQRYPVYLEFSDRDIAIFSGVILATTAVLLGYLVIGLIKDRSARTNVSAHSLRYNVVSAFLAIAIGISINATWPQSQYIASVMLYIMALTSSADWLEVTKDEIVTKLFDVATVILSALFVWNNSYLYRWCIQHDPRGLVFLAISLEVNHTAMKLTQALKMVTACETIVPP
ncbi:MAG: hypothetical protein JOS17DRAFT_773323 [Linnemannia elongata]|nr:MAG: hypothetical protein JOS17DRAFT_773323 [Linnemannia elongata]